MGEDKKLVIAIARSYGSGGLTLAKKLGKELGLPVYDREILRMASDQSGINEELFGQVDEHVRKIILSAKGKYKGLPLTPEYAAFTSDDNLFELQADVIKRIANTQSCIFVGRCADYILRKKENVVNVFVLADMPFRIERAQRIDGMPSEKIEENIRKMDKRRYNYYNFHTGEKWGKAENYDLCINSSRVGIDSAVQCIKAFVEAVK